MLLSAVAQKNKRKSMSAQESVADQRNGPLRVTKTQNR
jgi:hypothetical protein